MSRHWQPPKGKVVRIRPAGGKRLRSLDEWTGIQSYWRETAHHRKMPSGAKAGLLIVAAACVGVGIGAYQAFGPRHIIAPEAVVVPKAETVVPDVTSDPADAEWESRSSVIASDSEAIQPGLPRAKGARNDGVRVAFSYCKWGGGTNCVVDGDTFYLNGEKVRIAGIDAPETHDYRCQSELELGNQATEMLHSLLNSGAVTMTSIDRDRDVYGRLLRNVSVNGQDVGEAMISAGVARAYAGGRRPWC